jgi:rhodanese-related sulfurtransferase
MREIAPATLHELYPRGHIALIDVREHGEFNLAHIPGATSVPRRQLEFRIERLAPHRGAQIVVCDDDGRRAKLAATTLERLGYTRVAVLDGGVNRWAVEGYPTEWGMNVISKDFGERVEVEHHVPTIDALDLQRRIDAGEAVVIVDTRTPEEYRRFAIPGGRSLPGGEVALRIGEIVKEQPHATVVVNCAGRTRSIIGARVLQRMGLTNVISLRNGTSGWLLAGLQLEQGADRTELPEPSPESVAAAEAFARRIAAEDGVQFVSLDQLDELLARAEREPVYRVDVRTEGEFAAGHIPGFWSFPGGQAVQRADDVVAVRAAPVVFCCDGIVRATQTGSYYRQMGFPNVFVVEGGVRAWQAAGRPLETGMAETVPAEPEAAASVRRLTPAELDARRQASSPVIVFVDTSAEFARGHVPGARWIARGRLEQQIEAFAPDQAAPVVVTDRDGRLAVLAAAALVELGYTDVSALAGGTAAWQAAGLPVEQGLSGVMTPPDDVVPAGPDRSYADMMNYLRWEEALGRKYETPSPESRV